MAVIDHDTLKLEVEFKILLLLCLNMGRVHGLSRYVRRMMVPF